MSIDEFFNIEWNVAGHCFDLNKIKLENKQDSRQCVWIDMGELLCLLQKLHLQYLDSEVKDIKITKNI